MTVQAVVDQVEGHSRLIYLLISHRSWHCINRGDNQIIWMAPSKNRISRYISFSAHHSMMFCFRCSVYCWKGSVF